MSKTIISPNQIDVVALSNDSTMQGNLNGDPVVFTENANSNIFGGTGAGAALLGSAANNILIGRNAGSSIDTDDHNVIIGIDALTESSLTGFSVAIGYTAARYAGLSASVAVGYEALLGKTGDAGSALSATVAIGYRAGKYADAQADNSVFVGRSAGEGASFDRLTGDKLVYVGSLAGINTTTGTDNIAIGYQALTGTNAAPLTGASNVAVGSRALALIEGTANTNVAIGRDTLDVLTTGNQNTALGYNAGATITTGVGNVMLGYLAGPATSQSNKLFIDNSQTDTPLIGGDFSANTVTIGGTLATTGDIELGDNVRLSLGAGSDLDIYSNGTNSLLKYVGGGIFFESNSFTVAAFTQSATKLYFESSQKLETVTGGINVTGTITATDVDFTAYSENANSIATTGAVTLNASLATYFYNAASTGIITFTFSGAAATGRVTTFTLELFGGGTNAPVWPASVKWPTGTEPTWTTGVDVVTFVTRDAGTTWLGMLGGTAFA